MKGRVLWLAGLLLVTCDGKTTRERRGDATGSAPNETGGESGSSAGGATGGSGASGGSPSGGSTSGGVAGDVGGSGANSGGGASSGAIGGMSGAGEAGSDGGGEGGSAGEMSCPSAEELFPGRCAGSRPCAYIEEENCARTAGCAWDGATCSGTPTVACSTFMTFQDCIDSGCDWMTIDGGLLELPCSATTGDDCASAGWAFLGIAARLNQIPSTVPCTGTGLNAEQSFSVGGIPGESYRATFRFYGIVEPKNYGAGVTREAGNTRPVSNTDDVCSGDPEVCGANPPPWAYAPGGTAAPASDAMTYELHVFDETDTEECVYFLNSDTEDARTSYSLNFAKTINVIGGGRILLRAYDRNCRIVKNCHLAPSCMGSGASACNNCQHSIDISAVMPQPTYFRQPAWFGSSNQSGQWLLLDVTRTECGLPALGCDGT